MVDTAQSKHFNKLVRRISYTSGTNFIPKYAIDLATLFAEEKEISTSSWKNFYLDREKWGWGTPESFIPKKKNTPSYAESTARVLGYFELLKIKDLPSMNTGTGVFGSAIKKEDNFTFEPLYFLDILTLFKTLLDDENEFEQACKFAMIQKTLEVDGDYFVNCLLANFDENIAAEKIRDMFNYKFDRLVKFYSIPSSIDKLRLALSIEVFDKEGDNKNLSPFVPKKQKKIDRQFNINEDIIKYIKKYIIPSRLNWAIFLGLVDKGRNRTPLCEKLISFFENNNFIKNNFFVFWPYDFEFAKLSILTENIDEHNDSFVTRLELIKRLSLSFSNSDEFLLNEDDDNKENLNFIKNIFENYKNISPTGSTRHQIPLFILYPTFYYYFLSKNLPIPSLDQIIKMETNKSERKLNIINIRGLEGGVQINV